MNQVLIEKYILTILLWMEGLSEAQKLLGDMYANGDGVPMDTFRAIELYRKAAEQGHIGAKFAWFRLVLRNSVQHYPGTRFGHAYYAVMYGWLDILAGIWDCFNSRESQVARYAQVSPSAL